MFESPVTQDPTQRPLWWQARCDSTTVDGRDCCEGKGLDERRQCAWEQAVADEGEGDDPSPDPVQGPAPDELAPDATCTDAGCSKTCEREAHGFVHEAVDGHGNDVQVYCQCEHHDPASGFAAAAVKWVREGR